MHVFLKFSDDSEAVLAMANNLSLGSAMESICFPEDSINTPQYSSRLHKEEPEIVCLFFRAQNHLPLSSSIVVSLRSTDAATPVAGSWSHLKAQLYTVLDESYREVDRHQLPSELWYS
jgi:hypothetical protein